ncbi:MAG: succinate dehydrogenase [Chloroflexi bacterium]|nr:succinate dehydrogenase [Chloroflexota bacterium]
MSATAHTAPGRPLAVPARNLETWAWLFMRWSGVLLIPLVWIHVALQDVIVGVHKIDLDYVALRWAMVGWRVYDVALLAFAFAHGVNGLRAVVDDYVHDQRLNRAIKWGMFILWAVITAIGGVAIIGGVRK